MSPSHRRILLSSVATLCLLAHTAAAAEPQVAGLPFKSDAEYTRSWANAAVKAGAANSRGWTGYGRVVAIFDTGLYAAHPEFSGRVDTGYDALLGKVGVPASDANGHGTFVAGVIGAARNGTGMEGIAYDARLMSIRIANGDGSITLSDSQLAAGIAYATPRASTFNNSWNSTDTVYTLSKTAFGSAYAKSLNAWRDAAARNAVIVWAAGNAGLAQPGVYGALPAWYSELSRAWIVAVATEKTGQIASYSNRCGSAAAWCLAAPGSAVTSTGSTGGYATGSGTSFAAPVVSGGAAMMRQKWPALTNSEIRSILFKSANKTGIYANTSIYGQGLLDLDAATKPSGGVAVASGPTVATKTPVKSSSAVTAAAFGASLNQSSGTVMVLDEYNRDYQAPLAGFVAPNIAPYDIERGMMSLGAELETLQTPSGLRLAFASEDTTPDRLPRFSLQMPSGGNMLSFSHGVSSSHLFGGIEADLDGTAMLAKSDALGSAFRNLAGRDATGTAWQTPLGNGMSLTLATVFGSVADKPSGWTNASPYAELDSSRSHVTATSARVTAPVGPVRFGIETGLVIEDNTVLGSASEGAMAMGSGSSTVYTGLSAETTLGWGVSLFGGFEIGRTSVRAADDSMVSGLSDVTTTAFRVGAAKSAIIGDNDRMALTLSQPLRVDSGKAHFNLPQSRDLDGNVSFASSDQDVAAAGRELDLQLGYSAKLSDSETVTISGLVRFEPDNIQGAAPENIIMLGYRSKF
jgi:hypothetical protein